MPLTQNLPALKYERTQELIDLAREGGETHMNMDMQSKKDAAENAAQVAISTADKVQKKVEETVALSMIGNNTGNAKESAEAAAANTASNDISSRYGILAEKMNYIIENLPAI